MVKRVREITGGGADYAFDAIGSEATVLQIVDCICAGGRATMVGIPSVQVKAGISPAGMVFQEPEAQAIAETVEDEVAFGMEQHGIPSPEMRRRLKALIDQAAREGR